VARIRLSLVPREMQIEPNVGGFLGNVAENLRTEDWVAERSHFELSGDFANSLH